MRKLFALLIALVMVMTVAAMPAMAEGYTDGTYTGTGAGLQGPISVTVTVEGGAITAITVDQQQETPMFWDMVSESIPQAIIDAQTPDIDTTTGATYAATGIVNAVKDALGLTEEAAAMPFETPDMIVVGAGMGGVTAATRGAQLGLNVLLIEATGTIGGSANVAGGTLLGACTRMQAEAGIEDDPALCFADFVRLGGAGHFNTAIAYRFAEISGAAVDWLDDLGTDFGNRTPYFGVYQPLNVARNYSGNGGAKAFITAEMNELNNYVGTNAYIMMNTKVTSLVTDESGAVIGVNATLADGTETQILAPATVVATGGYGGSEELLTKYNFANILTTSPTCVTGDGFTWMEQLNVPLTNMEFCTSYAGGIRTNSENFRDFSYIATQNGSLWINTKGERIMDEMGADSHDRSETWANADQNKVYVVFTSEMIKEGAKIFSSGAWGSVAEEFEPFMASLIEKGLGWQADSVAELAEKAGLPVDTFVAAIEDYNAGCEAGVDSVGRTQQLVPMANGPFYAVESIPYVMITSGGPMMDPDGHPINNDGISVKGCYLAGEIVGMANVGGWNSIGGMGHGNCLVWGKQAAEKVLEDKIISVITEIADALSE